MKSTTDLEQALKAVEQPQVRDLEAFEITAVAGGGYGSNGQGQHLMTSNASYQQTGGDYAQQGYTSYQQSGGQAAGSIVEQTIEE